MTMQHRHFSMSAEFDLDRVRPFLERQANLRTIRAKMIHAASANQPGERAWFVLETFANCEKVVEKRLSDDHVQAYLPIVDGGKMVIRHRLVDRGMRPALPGYLMVSVVPSPAAFVALSRLKQVVGLVGGAENPHRVSDEDMRRFKVMLGEYDANSVHAEAFSRGDWVRFQEGPFIGYAGRITKIRKMTVVRDMRPIAVTAKVDVMFGDQMKTIDTPLALLEKL